jgi:nucleoside-diphosphate-sugar epimerase
MTKRVLILGGGGFIGINIARRLLDEGGYTITLADTGYRGRLEEYFDADERAELTVIEDDFTDSSAYNKLADHYDHVYMMAAIVGVNRTLEHPEEVIRVNTALTHYTLDWLQRAEVGRVVFASSSENYAATTDRFDAPIPTPESVPLTIGDMNHPRWTYAVTKMLGESAFLHTGPAAGFEATVVRYQNAFGPCMGFRHVIPHLVQRFWDHPSDQPFLIYGAEQTRAFCYVSDSVDGTIRAMETPAAAGEIFHVGNDEEISLETLTRAVGELMGYTGAYEHAPTYPGSVDRRCPDLTKCREQLGYEPQVPWREGLERTVQWYRDFFAAGRQPDDIGFEPPERFAKR